MRMFMDEEKVEKSRVWIRISRDFLKCSVATVILEADCHT